MTKEEKKDLINRLNMIIFNYLMEADEEGKTIMETIKAIGGMEEE